MNNNNVILKHVCDSVEVSLNNSCDEFGVLLEVGQQMKEDVLQSKTCFKEDNEN